ncbi:MAG: MobQ family relaxase [Oscillospiraceae bacterium]|nr:MobA/MobL family protein [Clostridiales bacterium]
MKKETKTCVCMADHTEVFKIAIYHFEAKMISRGTGRSVVAAAAYASCSKIYNDYDGMMHDYTRKHGCVYSEIFLPSNAPPEWQDRTELWNAVEAAEKAKDSRLARELIVALPVEIGLDEWKAILKDFISKQCVNKGMCADVSIHDTDGHNPHAHILLTMRPIDDKGKWQAKTQKEYLCKRGDEERGFTAAEFKTAQADGWEKQYQYKVDKKKLYMTPTEAEQQGYERVSKNPKSTRYGRQNPICAEWNSEEQVLRWRKAWEGVTNKALEQNSIDARVDCRSFKECGIDEQPTIHEGVSAHIIEQRGGVSERCEMNRQIKADNALLLEIKKQIKKLSAIVVDKVKKTVLDFANTLENLRNRYIFNRYEITQNENISTELKQYNTTIDVTVQRYNGIVQQLDNKITELKKMKAEQKHLNPIHIFRHKELTEHIDKTEKEIKKLQNLKSAFLDKMSCKSEKDIPQYKALHIKNDDIIIEIAANNTELEKQCADDKAEFISIKKSIPSEDMVAVQAERYTIHDEYTKSNIQKLQEKYGRKYSYDIYKDVEADVNMELHEKPFSILMRLEKNKQRNTDHNHTKYRNHEQER